MIRVFFALVFAASLHAGEVDDLLALHNAERAKVGVPALSLDARYCELAAGHSGCQAASGGRCYHSRLGLAENVAWKSTRVYSPAEVHESWMRSPGHRRNLLDPRWRSVGFGLAVGRNGTYWTAVFGAAPAVVVAQAAPEPKVVPAAAKDAKDGVVEIPDGRGRVYKVPANDPGLVETMRRLVEVEHGSIRGGS